MPNDIKSKYGLLYLLTNTSHILLVIGELTIIQSGYLLDISLVVDELVMVTLGRLSHNALLVVSLGTKLGYAHTCPGFS